MTLIALAILVPWLGAVALAALDGRRRIVGWIGVGIIGVNLGILVALATVVLTEGPQKVVAGGWPVEVGIVLHADALGVVFAILSSGVLLFAVAHEVTAGVRSRTFPALTLFMATGLTGLFLTGDVFNFYVFFELSMISAYVLTGYGQEARQISAAFIFAVVNLLGTFIFLLGIASIYHVTGTLEMDSIANRIAIVDPTSSILIAVTLLVAFSVKLGLFPFHFWLPAVYGGARPAVAAILSGAIANIGSYGLLRFGGGLMAQELRLGASVLIVLGTASIIYGSLQALSRRSPVEVLAYSAIGQAGYILIALGIGGAVGYTAAIVYAIVNSLNKVLLFLAVGVRGWLVGAAFVIGAFSVAGLPPSAGFFGKVALFQAGIETNSAALVALIFVGGALSFVYMFQIYQAMFWTRPSEGRALRSPARLRAITLCVALIVLAIGLWPEGLISISREAAAALPGGST